MKLHKIGDVYVWEGGFQTKDIPKNAGMRWAAGKKRWETKSIEVASKLYEYAVGDAREELRTEVEYRQFKCHLSGLDRLPDEIDINIPCPPAVNYREYQRVGIAYGYMTKNVLIADSMGLGKTVQAIGIINMLPPPVTAVLVVCPASLTLNWAAEFRTWLVRELSVNVVSPLKKKDTGAVINIVSYDSAKTCGWLHDKTYDIIIFDESHALKNSTTKRYEVCKELVKHSGRIAMLTGTPILNKPIELFPQLQLLGVKMGWYDFAKKYCDLKEGRYGLDASGASNLEELQQWLRSTYMVRRLISDVEKELPEKVRNVTWLPPEKYTEFLVTETDMFNQQDYEVGDVWLNPHMSEELPTIRKEFGMAKLGDISDHISNVLEQTDKVVVFAHHRDVINALGDLYVDISVKYMGGMSDIEKNAAVEAFQNDKDVRVFIGSIRAAGVGLTLTAASHLVFAEYDWTPGAVEQAEARIHRIGQKNVSFIDYIVVDGSVDSYMLSKMLGKKSVIDRAVNA